jgi:hypothetical protein
LYSTFEKYFEFIANFKDQNNRILFQQKKNKFYLFHNSKCDDLLDIFNSENFTQKSGSKNSTATTNTMTTYSKDLLLAHEKLLNEGEEPSDKKRKRKRSQMDDNEDDNYLDDIEENEPDSDQYKYNSHLTTESSSGILSSLSLFSSAHSTSSTSSTISTISNLSSFETKQSKKRRIDTQEMDMYLPFFLSFDLK